MLEYKDFDPGKKAFVFELDNVIYPEKDYLLQVYYLFSNFIEFTEGVPSSAELTSFFKTAYEHHGAVEIFDKAKEAFNIDEKYRLNFDRLHYSAILPLKLLMYKEVLKLMQEIIVDRKQLFLITNGKPEIQLNKIRQLEWNGLEKYLRVFYAEEIKLKPEPDVLTYILKDNNLVRKEVVIIGATQTDEDFAASCGVDYVNVDDFL
ncbi:FMN phosphatase YigB, HAD superfamily [Daejeonella lutea]|uniref:FMN phosphatase YigB, HAD superfamily n=2 Tax=Daejeonella lutea TaxID=572036 RepID=A0A1T5AFZ6_9SPHI|nr:FMN phosphatase YigB, HAD superfamily [Daejeonella lutea]